MSENEHESSTAVRPFVAGGRIRVKQEASIGASTEPVAAKSVVGLTGYVQKVYEAAFGRGDDLHVGQVVIVHLDPNPHNIRRFVGTEDDFEHV